MLSIQMSIALLNGNVTAGLGKATFMPISSACAVVTQADSSHSGTIM